MERSFSVTCSCCGRSFRVKIPENAFPGSKYQINYRCPGCGQQFRETRMFSEDRNGNSLKIIIGVPLVIVGCLLFASVIADRMGYESSVLPSLGALRQGFRSYTGGGNMTVLLARLFVILVCFPVHESAHAWMADRLGDPTGRRLGRITLNPFRHLDPWGTFTIFLLGFGYAKPVPVQINNFRNRKRDFAITALAGPVSNLLMAVLFLYMLRFLRVSGGSSELIYKAGDFLTYAAYINISLAVFNLIPVPPLDGSRVLTAFLPDGAYDSVLRKERSMMIVLLVALLCLGRMGYSPLGAVTNRIFHILYGTVMR